MPVPSVSSSSSPGRRSGGSGAPAASALPGTTAGVAFQLSGTSSGFASRSADVFSSLQSAESAHNAVEQQRQVEDRSSDAALMEDRGSVDVLSASSNRSHVPPVSSSSSFRRPVGRAPRHSRSRSPPCPGSSHSSRSHTSHRGMVRHSLADVSDEDMSDGAMSAAAFSFLAELRQRRQAESGDMDTEEDGKPLTFKRPERPDPSSEANTSSASSRNIGTTRVMDEYVVGRGTNRKRKHSSVPTSTSGETSISGVGLSHLEDVVDDGEPAEPSTSNSDTLPTESPVESSTTTKNVGDDCSKTCGTSGGNVTFKSKSKKQRNFRARVDNDGDDG